MENMDFLLSGNIDQFLSHFINKLNEKKEIKDEDIDLLLLITKKLVSEQSKESTNLLLKISRDIVLACCYKTDIKASVKNIYNVILTACTVEDVCIGVLKRLAMELQNDLNYINSEETTIYERIDITFMMVQMVLDTIAQYGFALTDNSFKEWLLELSATTIKMEMISDKNFLIGVHILNTTLDSKEELYQITLVSLMEKLYRDCDFKKLLLLLAINSVALSHSEIVKRDLFWKIIQDGLVCEDPLARKRSLFIVKCVLDVISATGDFQSDLLIMVWNKNSNDQLWKTWKIFSLLCETFEEKQMHVISPVMPLMRDIHRAAENNLIHHSWLLVLLNRAMKHESRLLNTWAINFSLHLDLHIFLIHSQEGWTFVFDVLLQSIKNIYLYTKEERNELGTLPSIFPLLQSFFASCFRFLSSDEQLSFWRKLINVFSSSTFNEIALVYITKALSSLKLTAEFQIEDVAILKDFLTTKFPVYKIEYQVLIFYHLSQFYTSNLDSNSQEIFDGTISLLSRAYSVGVMKLEGKCWSYWSLFLDRKNVSAIFTAGLNSYIKGSGSCKVLLILLQLLIERDSEDVQNHLVALTNVMLKLNTNPYLSSDYILHSLTFADMILTMIYKSKHWLKYSGILDLLFSYAPSVLEYIGKFVKYSKLDNDILQILEQCLFIIDKYIHFSCIDRIQNETFKQKLMKGFTALSDEINRGLLAFSLEQNQETNTYHLFILKLTKSLFTLSKQANVGLLQPLVFLATNFVRKELAVLQKRDPTSFIFNCDAFIINCWSCLDLLLKSSDANLSNDHKVLLLEAFQEDLDIVSRRKLSSIAGFSKNFIQMFQNQINHVIIVVGMMWKLLRNQLHSDQTFREIYRQCIEVIFHQSLLDCDNEQIIAKVNESWRIIFDLGETKPMVMNIAVECFFNTWNKLCGSRNLLNYITPLIQIALFGPLRQKRERPYNDLYYYVLRHYPDHYDDIEHLKSFQNFDQNVRVMFINFALKLKTAAFSEQILSTQSLFAKTIQSSTGDDQSSRIVVRLIQEFVNFEQNISKRCYYPNSEHHRKKLRSWQMILLLLPKLPKAFNCEDLFQQMCLSCKSDNQPSIRYLGEWAIILVILRDKKLMSNLLEELESATEKKIVSVVFILSISIQLVEVLSDEDFISFADAAIPKIFPWSNAHHVTSRVHSHIALERIWQRILKLESAVLKEKYTFLGYCFSLTIHNTAGVKHKNEILKSFMYVNFHVIRSYNLNFIFKTFPEQYGISSDEILNIHHFELPEENNRQQSELLHWKFICEEDSDEVVEGTNGVMEAALQVTNDNSETSEVYTDIQKKIMPWNLTPSDDLVLQSELSRKRDLGTSELILCTVLVDKIPNLGGLCRSAEIFGVKKMLIGSNRYVNDPNFRSLSVTSEKWIDIEQVLPIKLTTYLDEMRTEGYTVVGVEQTANSQMIGQFKFPKKTVLVLGNEKTGIPVELIQLLDECVEIPQMGIIRSLNVHISGAIMIWEYCKQHSL